MNIFYSLTNQNSYEFTISPGDEETGRFFLRIGNDEAQTVSSQNHALQFMFDNILNVVSDKEIERETVELYAMSGQLVLSSSVANTKTFTLPYSGLSAGVYLARLSFETGVMNRKVVVE